MPDQHTHGSACGTVRTEREAGRPIASSEHRSADLSIHSFQMADGAAATDVTAADTDATAADTAADTATASTATAPIWWSKTVGESEADIAARRIHRHIRCKHHARGPYSSGRWARLTQRNEVWLADVPVVRRIVADAIRKARALARPDGYGASLCVIVPYRNQPEQNRARQLERFVEELPRRLPRDWVRRWHVLVVEQSDDGLKFNRGKLLNAGYRIARSRDVDVDSFCFHDVDLLPRAREITQMYGVVPAFPVHMGYAWNRYKYDQYCGGVLTLGQAHMEASGGFPNDFWGWGGEDDVLSLRLAKVGFDHTTFLRPSSRGAELMEDLEETMKQEHHVRASEGGSRFKNVTKREQIRVAVQQAAHARNCIDDCAFDVLETQTLAPGVTKVIVDLRAREE
jgi:hypothetical protein